MLLLGADSSGCSPACVLLPGEWVPAAFAAKDGTGGLACAAGLGGRNWTPVEAWCKTGAGGLKPKSYIGILVSKCTCNEPTVKEGSQMHVKKYVSTQGRYEKRE